MRAISANTSVCLSAKRRWIVFGPLAQLFPVRRQEFAPRLLLIGRRGLVKRRHRQRSIIEVIHQYDRKIHGLKQRLRFVSRRESLCVVA